MLVKCTQKEFKDFEIKDLGEYHDLYLQSNALLLADVFGNFRNLSWKIWTPPYLFTASGLAWQVTLKKT